MKPIFERSVSGRGYDILSQRGVPIVTLDGHERQGALHLPEVFEQNISRHCAELTKATYGINDGFYPLGSCTMKHNPRIDEEMASLPKLTRIHPLQPESSVQGCLGVSKTTEILLYEITGMDEMSFQPAADAHGEFTGLLLVKAYRESCGGKGRKKIIAPDSVHGTNPASAMVAGFEVVNIPFQEGGRVDLEKLRVAVGEDMAGLILTNPNAAGLFDRNILDITCITHEAGGPNYYGGANLNVVMGIVWPDDMGSDVIHLNLYKTFPTPHRDGGPGSGPVGCKGFLAELLPGKQVVKAEDGGYHPE